MGTTTTGQGTLYPPCVVPGCAGIVTATGDVCGTCRAAFGPMLRPSATAPALTAEETAARDDDTRRAYAGRNATDEPSAHADDTGSSAYVDEREWKRNQRCWICEDRRSCVRVGERWECRSCETITA